MTELMDFQIIQRNSDGYADVIFSGTYEQELQENRRIVARVVRENDSLTVVFWTPCTFDGKQWSVTLRVPEGGLYRFEAGVQCLHGLWIDRIKCIYHVGVGDIYITTGQSNMTGYGRDTANDPITLGVHALHNNGKWCIAAHPLGDGLGSIFPDVQNACGTSPALSFARRLKEHLGIPIGIVPAAVGGSSLDQWHPEGSGEWYRGMCERIERIGKFKGYIWLQGCSDTGSVENADTYLERFSRMLDLWAEKFGRHPIITAQLNRWAKDCKDGEVARNWGKVLDAQRRAALEIDDVYVVPALDQSITDGIHNSSEANVVIGERMANTALANIYGKPGLMAPSVLYAEQINDTEFWLHITPGHHVECMDEIPYGMEIEDSEGLAACTRAVAYEDTLYVIAERPYTLPAKFHYAWRPAPVGFPARDFHGMPLLACYGMDIQPKLEQ